MGLITSAVVGSIGSGAALSSAVNLGDKTVTAIQLPAAWDAADLTFQTSYDYGTTWVDLIDATKAEVKVTAPAAGKAVQVNPSDFISCAFLKIRSGTSALPVNQTANRTITVFGRKLYPR